MPTLEAAVNINIIIFMFLDPENIGLDKNKIHMSSMTSKQLYGCNLELMQIRH